MDQQSYFFCIMVLLMQSSFRCEAHQLWVQEAGKMNFPKHEKVKRAAVSTSVVTDSATQIQAGEFDVSVIVQFPASGVSEAQLRIFLENTRQQLKSPIFPHPVSSTVNVPSVNLTTVCFPGLNQARCDCEDQYSWPCDNCECHQLTAQGSCNVLHGLPTDGQYCQAQTAVCQSCVTTTQPSTTASATSTTPPPSPITAKEYELSVIVQFPGVSQSPLNISLDFIRQKLEELTIPFSVSSTVNISSANLTTVCVPESNQTRCDCEDQYSWPCDQCECHQVTVHGSCDVIYGLPTDGQYCHPQTTACHSCTTTTTVTPTTLLSPNATTTAPLQNSTTLTISPRTNTTNTPINTTSPLNTTISSTLLPTSTTFSPATTANATSPLSTTMLSTTTTSSSPKVTLSPITTTSPPATTTPLLTTTTTATTTAPSTTTSQLTTATTTEPSLSERPVSYIMDLTFQEIFNSPGDETYKLTNTSIETGCRIKLEDCRVVSLSFRSGSTIVDSIVSASSIQDDTFPAVRQDIIREVTKRFSVITEGRDLNFINFPVPFASKAELACDPSDVSFSSTWRAEWYQDGINITSSPSVNNTGGKSVLTIKHFYRSNIGVYECRLINGNNIFRQRTANNANLTFLERPILKINQASRTIQCAEGSRQTITIECYVQRSVQDQYRLRWRGESSAVLGIITRNETFDCPSTFDDTCEVEGSISETSETQDLTLEFKDTLSFACDREPYGAGDTGHTVEIFCEEGKVGNILATCDGTDWVREDNCVLVEIQELLDLSKTVNASQVPEILAELADITTELRDEVTDSAPTIRAVVLTMEILGALVNSVTDKIIKNVLVTSSILTGDDAIEAWETLNDNVYGDVFNSNRLSRSVLLQEEAISSRFVQNLEDYAEKLVNSSANISTENIVLNKTEFNFINGNFQETYSDQSVQMQIESRPENNEITVLVFESLDNVLPAVNESTSENLTIGAKVVIVQTQRVIENVSLTFELQNNTFQSLQCVFWNFSLLFNASRNGSLGAWDDSGCTLVNYNSTTATCNCDHLTPLSILFSPFAPKDPALEIITYIGVSISIVSLIICLIIEAVVWKKVRKPRVSYFRHVVIVNIAVCLLIANIWFMIGAFISDEKHQPSCTAATFFIHLFYLAMFFWMLVLGLHLLYHTVNVFGTGITKRAMLAIGFCIGYGAPLIIAVVTIASTAGQNQYTRLDNVCWLNWDPSYALLAFVIPVLTIVAINFVILCVVLYKILRRRSRIEAHSEEKHVLVVIIRCLAFLTPLFGLTWILGVATMIDIKDANSRRGVHVSFALFNSLQGFFVLLFGTLLDKKVRKEIAPKTPSSRGTATTSGGPASSSSGLSNFQNRFKRWRNGYTRSNGSSSGSNS